MKKRENKSVYDPFLNKKISIDEEPYKEYSEMLESKEHQTTLNNKAEKKPTTQNQVGFFGSLKSALLSDIVWLSVSISLLIATVLFYFQVLQPRILKNIGSKAQTQIALVQSEFSDQVKSFSTTRNEIITKNTMDLSGVCNEDQLYRDSQQDSALIKNLSKKTEANTSLENLESYFVFTSQEIQDEYKTYFEFYKKNISDLKKEIGSFTEYVNFKEYQNEWIENCITLDESINVSDDLDEICTKQQPSINKEKFPTLFSQIETLSDKQIELCTNWNDRLVTFTLTPITAVQTKLDWLSLIDEITVIDTELFSKFSQTNQNIDTDRFQSTTQSQISKIDSIVESKKGIDNIWYILDTDL